MKWVRNNFNLFGLLSRRGVLIHRYWELVTVLHLSAVLMVTLYIDFFFFPEIICNNNDCSDSLRNSCLSTTLHFSLVLLVVILKSPWCLALDVIFYSAE